MNSLFLLHHHDVQGLSQESSKLESSGNIFTPHLAVDAGFQLGRWQDTYMGALHLASSSLPPGELHR